MKEKLDNLIKEAIVKISECVNTNDINNIKSFYLGKKSTFADIMKNMYNLTSDEKKEAGVLVNEFRNKFDEIIKSKAEEIYNENLVKELQKDKEDITLPGLSINEGTPHILEKVIEDLESLFISMGYTVVEGPEVEKDLYNFELLNLPIGHPARDEQDTFYIEGEEILLRSQTSPVQIRTMLDNKEKTSIRIICPGKTYRRDYDDASHSHQFMQIEGLLVDKDISLADLKGTLELMVHHLFGNNVSTRFRPSYYPFTDPSIEFDISCFNCNSKGCNVCKNTGWITIGGAGLVHPNVLNNCGYDSDIFTGFAFGFGIERISMIKYGINNIRTFYTNDLRSKEIFSRREN
ncbi:MAG: phenylalanine--tRNA ligase subunit alpha [Bacilli bacterium]